MIVSAVWTDVGPSPAAPAHAIAARVAADVVSTSWTPCQKAAIGLALQSMIETRNSGWYPTWLGFALAVPLRLDGVEHPLEHVAAEEPCDAPACDLDAGPVAPLRRAGLCLEEFLRLLPMLDGAKLRQASERIGGIGLQQRVDGELEALQIGELRRGLRDDGDDALGVDHRPALDRNLPDDLAEHAPLVRLVVRRARPRGAARLEVAVRNDDQVSLGGLHQLRDPASELVRHRTADGGRSRRHGRGEETLHRELKKDRVTSFRLSGERTPGTPPRTHALCRRRTDGAALPAARRAPPRRLLSSRPPARRPRRPRRPTEFAWGRAAARRRGARAARRVGAARRAPRPTAVRPCPEEPGPPAPRPRRGTAPPCLSARPAHSPRRRSARAVAHAHAPPRRRPPALADAPERAEDAARAARDDERAAATEVTAPCRRRRRRAPKVLRADDARIASFNAALKVRQAHRKIVGTTERRRPVSKRCCAGPTTRSPRSTWS